MTVSENNGSVTVSGISHFSVSQTFDCGQCFRFRVTPNEAEGIAGGRKIKISQISLDTLVLSPCTEAEYENYWKHYLALDEDYSLLRRDLLLSRPEDGILTEAAKAGEGIRLLRQEPWETLCSFIISQNNNIPRIKGLISALCRRGMEIEKNSDGLSAGEALNFPSPETVYRIGEKGLREIKMGFRAAYLVDAARQVLNGNVDLGKTATLPLEEGIAELTKIKGVGIKVASCTLLFGFGKTDAFPVDVWMKRVLHDLYGDAVMPADFGRYAGLAQQYLFYYAKYRTNK